MLMHSQFLKSNVVWLSHLFTINNVYIEIHTCQELSPLYMTDCKNCALIVLCKISITPNQDTSNITLH